MRIANPPDRKTGVTRSTSDIVSVYEHMFVDKSQVAGVTLKNLAPRA